MIRIDFKEAFMICFWFFIGTALFQYVVHGMDFLIIDLITPVYWMVVTIIALKISSIEH